jgi:hypothetical protein
MPTSVNNPESFRAEAKWQGVCAVTGKGGAFQAHHVVERQELKRRGLPEWDPRNALRLAPRAHDRHTLAVRRVKTKELTDDNIEYAFEVLGDAAQDYLRRYYDDDEPDLRIGPLHPCEDCGALIGGEPVEEWPYCGACLGKRMRLLA